MLLKRAAPPGWAPVESIYWDTKEVKVLQGVYLWTVHRMKDVVFKEIMK